MGPLYFYFLQGPGHTQQWDVVGRVRRLAAPHAARTAEDANVRPARGAHGEHVLRDGTLCKHKPSSFCTDGSRPHLPAAEAPDDEGDDAFVGSVMVPSKDFFQVVAPEVVKLVFSDEDRAFVSVNALYKVLPVRLHGGHDCF